MDTPYSYQALTLHHSIRLLRLSPSTDYNAPLYGQLFVCNLTSLYSQNGFFEALSYVWGCAGSHHSISLDGHRLDITMNLYAALTDLRYQHSDRILWVDAMCINQTDDREKEHQIGLMYRIYACASRVVVWLGETKDESEHVFEDLRIINHKMLSAAKEDYPPSDRIIKFFQRPWFRRVWILQEVSAARNVQMRCGHTSMDGYAFSGAAVWISSWLKFRGECQELPEMIRSVAYLIQWSIFRSPYEELCTLPEGVGHFKQVIDMFHNREATKVHDKVFALLGMSSNDMRASGLLPNYTVPFCQLFERLVKFVMSNRLVVGCQKERPLAVIEAKGHVLGNIQRIEMQSFNTQRLEFQWAGGKNDKASPSLTLPLTSKPVRENDLICLLDGAATPTIIRLYEDYSVIVVAAPLLSHSIRDAEIDAREWSDLVKRSKLARRRLLLIWDWDYHDDLYSHLRYYTTWSASTEWSSEESTLTSDELLFQNLIRRCDQVLVASDGYGYRTDCLKEILGDFETLLQLEKNRADGKTKLYEFLQCIRKSPAQSPSSRCITLDLFVWAFEARLKITARHISEFNEIHTEGSHCSRLISRSELELVWESGDMDTMTWLVRNGADVNQPTIGRRGRTVLQAAAERGDIAMVDVLLQAGALVNAGPSRAQGRTALQGAAEQGHIAIVRRLLQANADVNAPAAYLGGVSALEAAAVTGNVPLVQILLKAGAHPNTRNACGNTPLMLASARGHAAVVKALLEKDVDLDAQNLVGETALMLALENEHTAIMKALLIRKASINVQKSIHSALGSHKRHVNTKPSPSAPQYW